MCVCRHVETGSPPGLLCVGTRVCLHAEVRSPPGYCSLALVYLCLKTHCRPGLTDQSRLSALGTQNSPVLPFQLLMCIVSQDFALNAGTGYQTQVLPWQALCQLSHSPRKQSISLRHVYVHGQSCMCACLHNTEEHIRKGNHRDHCKRDTCFWKMTLGAFKVCFQTILVLCFHISLAHIKTISDILNQIHTHLLTPRDLTAYSLHSVLAIPLSPVSEPWLSQTAWTALDISFIV